jgi:hypothetical protein
MLGFGLGGARRVASPSRTSEADRDGGSRPRLPRLGAFAVALTHRSGPLMQAREGRHHPAARRAAVSPKEDVLWKGT